MVFGDDTEERRRKKIAAPAGDGLIFILWAGIFLPQTRATPEGSFLIDKDRTNNHP